MEVNKGYSWKKFFRDIFNLFWILTVGLSSAISHAVTGVLQCITIIGIPFGKAHFAFIKLVFAPAGKVVVTKFSRHPFLNTLWLIFGGFALCLQYLLVSGLLYLSIIGIPLAKQLSKLRKYVFAPFGADIVKDGEYSKYKDTPYDIKLLNRHICANPAAPVMERTDGKVQTAREYIRSLRKENAELVARKTNCVPLYAFIVFWLFLAIMNLPLNVTPNTIFIGSPYASTLGSVGIAVVCCLVLLAIKSAEKKRETVFLKKHLLCLLPYYPNCAPIAKEKFAWYDKVQKAVGLPTKKREMKTYLKRICANPEKELLIAGGKQITAMEYMQSKKKAAKKLNKNYTIAIIAIVLSPITIYSLTWLFEIVLARVFTLDAFFTLAFFTLAIWLLALEEAICLQIIVCFLLFFNAKSKRYRFLVTEVVYPLLDYYPKDTPESKKQKSSFSHFVKTFGLNK